MAATREGVQAVRERYGDVIRAGVDEWPPIPETTVGLLKAAGFPLRPQSEDRGAA
jgi:hypothetical protein